MCYRLHITLTHLDHWWSSLQSCCQDYSYVIMSTMVSQITSVLTVCSTVCSGAVQRKYQSSGSLAFVRGIHQWPVDSSHKGPVTQKMFPFDDVIMKMQHCWDTIWISDDVGKGNPSPWRTYLSKIMATDDLGAKALAAMIQHQKD